VTIVRRFHRDERGQMGGIEAIPFGLLLFVVAALLLANAWAVVDAKLAVDAAAREAARTWVEGDGGEAARAAAVEAGQEALAGHGRDPDRADIELVAPSGFGRCATVEVVARYTVPAVPLPWIGGFGSGITVTARHAERVDPFRDGLPGAARC
jgi:hypothetical protein